MLTADWDRDRLSAARETLSWRATATKDSNWRRVNFMARGLAYQFI